MKFLHSKPKTGLVFAIAFSVLFGLVGSHGAQARFELIKEWVIPESIEEGFFTAPLPSWPLDDGSMYLWDTAEFSPYSLWHLKGTTLSPVTGFSHGPARFQPSNFFNVGNMVVLSGLFDSAPSHWRIDGTQVVSLEPQYGPIPFTAEWLWTPTDSGVVLSARHEAYGRELWLMDENGYHLIADHNPGPADSHPGEAGWDAVPIFDWYGTFSGEEGPQSQLMYGLDNGSTGSEPWVYNAADNALSLVGDLVEGPDGSHPWWLGAIGVNQYFGTIDRQIYRSDESIAVSIDDRPGLFSYGSRSRQHWFEFGGNLYPWWEPHGLDQYGYITRITSEDTVDFFRARVFPGAPVLELTSVFPFDGAVQILAGSTVLKLQDDQVVQSELFSGESARPEVIAWTENELLFRETSSGAFQDDIYCLTNGEAVAVWRKPTDILYASSSVVRRGEWIYLRTTDFLAIGGEAGGTVQLWGMHFPGGCQDAWPEDFLINASLNDAWYNPDTSGQGFFITVYEELGTVFAAWFTYDAERPDGSVQAILGEPGHRWMTAYGPFEGDRADLDLELTFGGVFNSAVPVPDQQYAGELEIQFTGCNSAVLSYEISNVNPVDFTPSGTIAIERIALDNVAACEQ